MGGTQGNYSGGGWFSALSSIYQGWSEKQYSDLAARFLDMEADYQAWRGKFTAKQVRKKGKSFAASQRAAMARQGIDTGSGSALDVAADTASKVELDALMAETEGMFAESKARTQALLYRLQGKQAFTQGLLTGLSKWNWQNRSNSWGRSNWRSGASNNGWTSNYPWNN
jgi:hypothetical protein